MPTCTRSSSRPSAGRPRSPCTRSGTGRSCRGRGSTAKPGESNRRPGNVAKMRREAAKRGLDPDKWFNNVEVVTAEKIGIETTTYVRNIYKYYAAYKLTLDVEAERNKAREQMAPAKK